MLHPFLLSTRCTGTLAGGTSMGMAMGDQLTMAVTATGPLATEGMATEAMVTEAMVTEAMATKDGVRGFRWAEAARKSTFAFRLTSKISIKD